jgi:hypothetical protein
VNGPGAGTQGWHIAGDLVERYAAGRMDVGLAASVEAHLMTCERCRHRLAAVMPPRVSLRLEDTWSRIRATVEVPPLPPPVRLLRRLGITQETAVVLATARSMSGAWTLATVVVLTFAAAAAFVGDTVGVALYLVVAPLVPVAGVVAAFSSSGDSVAELTGTTPYPSARLVLLRAGGVALTSVPLAVGVGLAVPGAEWLAFAWLAPALAFILAVLAASTWCDPVVAGGCVAVGWAAVVTSALRTDDPLLPVAAAAQPAYLVAAVLAGVLLAARIHRSRIPGGVR